MKKVNLTSIGGEKSPPIFRIAVERGLADEFLVLFQNGVFMRARAGMSAGEFMEGVLGLDPEYIRTRVSTIFLNGMPVDDVEKAHLAPGCVLSLSAAMPGLVGATLRKGGILSPMRSGISYREDASATGGGGFLVRLKLFNMIMREAGPDILLGGVIVPASAARAVIDLLPPGALYREEMDPLPEGDVLIELIVEPLGGRAG
ncbi:MAG: hypothetical protein EPN93_07630 [Spirochaetes bacterium]|nr:MAG: hypothetical protein EPN93_07630 [Spirochaetota bacterium]